MDNLLDRCKLRLLLSMQSVEKAYSIYTWFVSELALAIASDVVLDRYNDLAYGTNTSYRPDLADFRRYLFPWEEQVIERLFPPPPARILIGGAGGGREVFALARRGDPMAGRVVADEARRLATGLAVVMAVVDLELIILGGGVGGNADLLLPPIERELRTLSPVRPRLAVSALGEDAVLQGAVATALEVAQSRLFDPATLLDRKELVV